MEGWSTRERDGQGDVGEMQQICINIFQTICLQEGGVWTDEDSFTFRALAKGYIHTFQVSSGTNAKKILWGNLWGRYLDI